MQKEKPKPDYDPDWWDWMAELTRAPQPKVEPEAVNAAVEELESKTAPDFWEWLAELTRAPREVTEDTPRHVEQMKKGLEE